MKIFFFSRILGVDQINILNHLQPSSLPRPISGNNASYINSLVNNISAFFNQLLLQNPRL